MAGKVKGDNSGHIYVEADYNNIIIVDPNKIVDSENKIQERLVDHENMVMYVNLEAELLPRTKLAVGSSPDNIRIVSIAKMNFLKPTKGQSLTTEYYDEITGENSRQGEGINQSNREYITPSNGEKPYNKYSTTTGKETGAVDTGLLGITSINFKMSTSFVPTVSITLEDVQGRALFQLGESSPYAAFFHLPYPPFYLTLKGYYGQALRYQLNLHKFSASFNSSTGNYQINLEFQGYKFNILNEINLGHLLAAPHMYSTRFDISNSNTGAKPSDKLQTTVSQQSASIPNSSNSTNTVVDQIYTEKGYQKIAEVYSKYKAKELIEKDFPELTLQQLMYKLQMFEDTIINNYEPKTNVEALTNIRTYKKDLNNLYENVINNSSSWFRKWLNPKPFIGTNGVRYYAFKDEVEPSKKDEAISKLTEIINTSSEKLNTNKTLGKDGTSSIKNDLSIKQITATTTKDDINWTKTVTEQEGIITPTLADETRLKEKYPNLFTPTTVQGVNGGNGGFITAVNKDNTLLQFLNTVLFVFDGDGRFNNVIKFMDAEASKKLSEYEQKISEDLAKKLEDPNTGLGFKPTVRNVISVIMASAEGFIRLMDDVHTKAWDVKYDPIRKSAILNNNIGSDTKNVVPSTTDISQIPVYPWPQFFFETNEDKKGKYQLRYIADPRVVQLTKGYLYDKWPEVEFVEEFINGLTQKYTPPSSPTPSSVSKFTNILNINAIEFPFVDNTYANKEEVKFFFEIWERQFLTSRYENLFRLDTNKADFNELTNLIIDVESKNLLTQLGKSNPNLNFKLKNFDTKSNNYVEFLRSITKNGTTESAEKFDKDIFVTQYIESITKNSFGILSLEEIGKTTTTTIDDKNLEKIVKTTTTNESTIMDIFPFTNSTWTKNNLIDDNLNSGNNRFNTTKVLKIYKQRNVISNFTDLNDFSTNRPVTNFSYLSVANPLSQSQTYTTTNQTGFLPYLYNNRTPKSFIPTEGYCYFDVPNNSVSSPLLSVTTLPIRTTTSIINTPIFINAILEGVDKWRNKDINPFVSAAYLFLNSLPLTSLREKYKNNGGGANDLDYIFASLKKFGGIHKLPYAWILKIGSVWHRYKKFKETGIDILNNCWKNVDYKESYDPITKTPTKVYNLKFNNTNNVIQLENVTNASISIQSGFYPKLINDFNYFYKGTNLYSTYTDSEIQSSIDSGMKIYNFVDSNLSVTQNNIPLSYQTWSVLIPNGNSYQTVPSFGGEQNQVVNSLVVDTAVVPLTTIQTVRNGYTINNNNSVYNGSMRTLWAAPNYGYFDISQITKPNYDEYLNKITGTGDDLSPFNLLNSSQYSKMEELFSVFEKEILDKFELEFQGFSNSMDNITVNSTPSSNIGSSTNDPNYIYKNFQVLFKTLMSVDAPQNGQTNEVYFKDVINKQLGTFSSTILKFLEYDVIFKFGNPSGYNRYYLDSFILNKNAGAFTAPSITLKYPELFESYQSSTLIPDISLSQSRQTFPNEWKALDLYVGFSTIPELVYKDGGSYITDFFKDNNIRFTVDNIKNLAPIIKMYATQKLITPNLNYSSFRTLLNDYINRCNELQKITLDGVLNKIKAELPDYQEVPEKVIESKIDGTQSKVDIYEHFKAVNDKWIAGSDFKSKTIFEDMLFLDRASRNIGETLFLDIFSLKELLNERAINVTMSVHTFIAGLLIKNNFTIMNLPAYVNFYNVQNVDGLEVAKGTPSLEFADNMWGTFLNVDYTDAGPKLVCFYVGKPSNYVEMQESTNFLFKSDAFNLTRPDNPLVENQTGKKDWSLSNKCVGFTVDIGIRNQNVFSSFNVTQDNGKATAESIETLYNMINQASGRDTATQNVSLWNYYNNRSYGCQVVCLGNAMIQPTMYFNLRNVPMFNGPYFITDVSHVISPGTFQTTFTGTRQAIFDYPAIDSFLQSINKNMLTKLEETIINRNAEENKIATNNISNSEHIIQSNDNTIDAENACVDKVYKGSKDVYKSYVSIKGTGTTITEKSLADTIKALNVSDTIKATIFAISYLRTYKSGSFNGVSNNFALVSLQKEYGESLRNFIRLTYSCVSSETTSSKKESIPVANFATKELFVQFMAAVLSNRDNQILNDLGLHQYYITQWQDNPVTSSYFESNRNTLFKNSYDTLKAGLEVAKRNGINVPNVDELLLGKKYIETQKSTTTTPVVVPPPVQSADKVFDIQKIKDSSGNEEKITISIKPDAGLWKFEDTMYEVITTPCSQESGNILPSGNVIILKPVETAKFSCNKTNKNGDYTIKYTVSASPVDKDGKFDTTRKVIVYIITSILKIVTPLVAPPTPPSKVFGVEKETVNGNDTKVTVSILPNAGKWKIVLTSGLIFSTTPCSDSGGLSSPGDIIDNYQKAVFNPLQDAKESCSSINDRNVKGQVPIEYEITADPILDNGSLDTTRNQLTYAFTTIITF